MKRWIRMALLVAILTIGAGTVLAHERIEVGDYVFVVGWLEEPPLVGLKNAALVEITLKSDDSPVTGAEGSLNARIEYGGQSRDLLLRPLDEPGLYAADFIPTRRGVYTLKINGTLGEQSIDISSEIEEVISAGSAQFPEVLPAPADLQQSIDDLRSEVGTARAFAVAGAALGTIGLALAGAALRRRP